LEQLNVLGETTVEAMLQLSVEPTFIVETASDAVPAGLKTMLVNVDLHTATGGVVSKTVTTATHVVTFPLASVAVKVTFLEGTSAQLKVNWEADRFTVPQLSDEDTWISLIVMEAELEPSRVTVKFLQDNAGLMVSLTVTLVIQVATLFALSVTVKVTGLAPTLVQSKLDLEICSVIGPLSEDPLSISEAVIVASPLASRSTTILLLQRAVGELISITVTKATQLEVLPEASVAVRVTGFNPRLEELKVFGETAKLKLQLSEELKSTSDG